jgi:Rieske Fe-S protein
MSRGLQRAREARRAAGHHARRGARDPGRRRHDLHCGTSRGDPARARPVRAFSAVCTHVGCILSQVTGRTIDCPCHGSKFAITSGAVVAGPAPTPLPRKQIEIVDGRIVLT